MFGEDPIDSGGHDVDLDAGLGLDNDDWIIDDVGMLDEDHDQGKRNADGFTKEMGLSFLVFHLPSMALMKHLNSEHHESAASVSAWRNSI